MRKAMATTRRYSATNSRSKAASEALAVLALIGSTRADIPGHPRRFGSYSFSTERLGIMTGVSLIRKQRPAYGGSADDSPADENGFEIADDGGVAAPRSHLYPALQLDDFGLGRPRGGKVAGRGRVEGGHT